MNEYKVEWFYAYDFEGLKSDINKFLKGHNIIPINIIHSHDRIENENENGWYCNNIFYTAILLYEEL
jgi:hypothetical protein